MPTLRNAPVTTPICYITHLLPDAFNMHMNTVNTFSYFSDEAGWILVSPGPDRVFEIVPWDMYSGKIPQPSSQLLSHSYDPTNGTVSGGDIFRVHQ